MSGSRFGRGCPTEEKAKQLRTKTIESSTFHETMYHSAIVSRLASDLSGLQDFLVLSLLRWKLFSCQKLHLEELEEISMEGCCVIIKTGLVVPCSDIGQGHGLRVCFGTLYKLIDRKKLHGSLSTVKTLASTTICGIIQSIFGGQSVLVLRVAEPTVIMYFYLYNFAKERADLDHKPYLLRTGWLCVWTALLLFLLAIFNACTIINTFTRVARERFVMLIAVFLSNRGILIPVAVYKWVTCNHICFGPSLYCLELRAEGQDHGGMAEVAEYGVPLMVVIWTALSFTVPLKVPSGVPRRLFSPLLWDSKSLKQTNGRLSK
ncbi:Boron transporter 4 [Ancistrocladus abbreviatus]